MTNKELKERIRELEAMVAIANVPSEDDWPDFIVKIWRHEQVRIRRKWDGIKNWRGIKNREAKVVVESEGKNV